MKNLEGALSRYMLKTQKALKYQEGYHLLKDCPKFMPLPKSTGAEIAEDGEQGIFKTPERPIGRDSAKKRNRDQAARSEDISEQRQRLLETAQHILASSEEKRKISQLKKIRLHYSYSNRILSQRKRKNSSSSSGLSTLID